MTLNWAIELNFIRWEVPNVLLLAAVATLNGGGGLVPGFQKELRIALCGVWGR